MREKDNNPASNFVSIFPGFVWTVRDFTLQLRAGEKTLSEDEYLEDVLRLQTGMATSMSPALPCVSMVGVSVLMMAMQGAGRRPRSAMSCGAACATSSPAASCSRWSGRQLTPI